MRVSAVSGDLLVKLVLIAAGVGLAVYLVRRQAGAVSDVFAGAAQSAEEFADSIIVGVNPSNPSNWVNQAVTGAGSAIVAPDGPGRNADGSWTLGGWLYDVTHADPVGQMVYPAPAALPDYGADPAGAAFGFFPGLSMGRNAQTQANLRTIAERGRVVGGL